MTETLQRPLRRVPSIWACYPRVVLVRRPPITEVVDPPEFVATVHDVELDAGTVAGYATMCGFDPSGPLPVTFPHVLAMPLHLKIFGDSAFALRPMGLIHLSNTIESLGPLVIGDRVDVRVEARNYQRADSGITFDIATEIRCGSDLRWRENCVFLSRWPDDMLRAAGGRPPRPPKAPKDSAVLAELDVSLKTAWAYARVAGDYNPIHLSERAAKFLGLRGAISHGMWSLARSLAQAPLPSIPEGVRIETQFLTPVQLPARVAIKEWRADGQLRRAMCDLRTGRVHMYAWWEDAGAPT